MTQLPAAIRLLTVIDSTDPLEVLAALRAALAGGPAILPRPGGLGVVDAPPPAEAAAPALPTHVDERIAVVVETSGTSGAPKRVALSADALLASTAASAEALGGGGQWLLALPTHYIAGIQVLVRSIAAETQPVILAPGHFAARDFASLADTMTAPLCFTSLVPAQLSRLVEAGEADEGIRRSIARLDTILIGGQALAAALHARAAALGFTVTRTYGSSETAGGCVYDGRPIGAVRVRVTNGEVELSGPVLAEGYLGDEALTAEKFTAEKFPAGKFPAAVPGQDAGRRWYRTNDAGEVTDGMVSVFGRRDNVIISGGVKVSLDRVERTVQEVSDYADALVVPVPSDEWGQVSVVVVAGGLVAGEVAGDAAGEAAELARIRSAVIAAAGREAAPARILRLASLPLLSSGKPDRRELARLATAADRQ